MFPLILGLAQRLALWLLAILLLGGEYLDWFGRLDVLEVRHPKVHRFVNSRPLRLVLLLLVFAMLSVDFRTNLQELNAEPLVVKPVIPSADGRLCGASTQSETKFVGVRIRSAERSRRSENNSFEILGRT